MAAAAGKEKEGHRWTSGFLGQKRKRARSEEEEEGLKEMVFYFKNTFKHMNSNMSMNSNIQRQCYNMYATVNSYTSLFN
jgi:hypothetical protein